MAMTIVRCPNRLHIYHTLYSLFQMNLVCNNNQYLVYISFTKKRNDIVPGRGSYIEMTLFQEGRGGGVICLCSAGIDCFKLCEHKIHEYCPHKCINLDCF